MTETRIKISSIVENQLPQFVKEEFPLVSEFLSQYYISLESLGNTSDLLQNIDQYIKIDNLTNLIDSTILTSDVTFFDSTINVKSTAGFPNSYGLLLIDDEIITYKSKTDTTFEDCVRGFNGVTSYNNKKDELSFSDTESQDHFILVDGVETKVTNLSILFLKEFLTKIKKQITPGFESRELYSELSQKLFIKQSIDFYSSKGTDNSFKILFGALYGENVKVIKPRDYLIQPSDAQYRTTADLVVESIEGNPENLVNGTLYQDETSFIDKAQGTITRIEKIRRNSKDYYIISLDYDYDKDIKPIGTVFGEFSIHSKTKSISLIDSQSTTIEVDSTVGFPKTNGNLIVNLENGTSLNITYKSKTLNQFLGCSGITQEIPSLTEIKLDSFAYGYYEGNQIKIRILGVISNLDYPNNTIFYSKNDTVKIKTLGINLKNLKENNWFFNIPTEYDVSFVKLLDISDRSYEISLYDNHSFRIGDSVTLVSSGIEQTGSVVSFNNEKSFSIQFGSEQSLLDENISYVARKNLSKVSLSNYPLVNRYLSNVQNIYYDNVDNSLYVASPSLPTYLKTSLNVQDRSILFSGSFNGTTLDIGKHGLYTGDSIVYKPSLGNTLGISTGVYFVKKISDTEVKLSRSRSNILTNNFVEVNGSVQNGKFEFTDFTYQDLTTQTLESQKLLRKLSDPETDGKIYKTSPGLTGIFVNGVELLNYKSKDNVYYGPIEKIIPSAEGSGYDIINPPVLTISDTTGSGANGYCSVIGGLERIDIIDPGFDYLEDPVITITGGNGSGVSVKPNLLSFDHEVSFNSSSNAKLVKVSPTNTIGFSTYHKFRDAEEVVYITNGQSNVGGLTTSSTYFVSIQDGYTVKLHKSFNDAVAKSNPIELTSYGVGNHIFKSKNKKKKIGSITIENSGVNYQNKLTTTTNSGISTSSDIVTIVDHGYSSGEIITYHATETPIGGLSSSTSYYVTKINDDQFKLSSVGTISSGVTTSFFYDTNQYINFTSLGSGVHKFNYPEIKLKVNGRIGVSTLSNQDFNAILVPIFRGKIQSVFVESGGVSYGAEEVINYNKQPLFELNSGSGIQLTPIISEGKITDVIINSSGTNYNSPPNLEIIGDGKGAILTPILLDGYLIDVKVIYGGGGYDKSNTSIIVSSSGSGAKFEAKIKSWKINLIQRLIENFQINDDDGILTSGLNSEYGLEYTHGYAPRYLRSSVQATSFKEGKKVYTPDLQIFANREQNSSSHSPIIGWAYDGNPIYGPYGYSNKTGGIIKLLKSGYEYVEQLNRPKTSIYPQGFFIEDYVYTGNGDLDEHNGRFGITPEYPNGTYAYFTTINSEVDESGIFANYKKPIFPYVIGDAYKSKPIEFNFNYQSNQDFIDINQTNWRRNTTPYNLLNNKSRYNYLLDLNELKTQNSTVKNISSGSIDSIKIVSGGQDYQVGDKVSFENVNEYEPKAKVSLIKGKTISNISVATSSFSDVKLYPYGQELIGFTTIPHGYLNNDLITFTGKYDYKKSGNIKVNVNNLVTTSGIQSTQYTGLVTYFYVSGNLQYPNIKENDIYEINNEQIKVLNIDTKSSRIRVLRNQNNTIGLTSYVSGSILTEKSKKFNFNFGISTSYNFNIDKEIYFNPKESLGLGTVTGVGIVSTIYFSNPGAGITQITVPTKSIYIENHGLNTGDSLIYSSNSGTSVSVSTDGTSSFQLSNNSIVYVAKLSNNLIGISTVKVGLNSTGTFVGIATTTSSNETLYFTGIGTNTYHSFKTIYENPLIGQVNKNVVTVSTAETHGLSLLDNVIINVKSGLTTTFVVKYNDYNRRLLINPKIISSIDTNNNTILINNHDFYNGQKVIYTSNTPASGLENEKIYYVIIIDTNNIKLSNSYYGAVKIDPDIIDISSSTSGNISPVNPSIKVLKNQTIIFDLSDSSLSFVGSGVTYSAFDFKIYKDEMFREEFDSTQSSSSFEVSKIGKIGIDSDAKVILKTNNDTPNILYYNLISINEKINLETKKQIFTDSEVLNSNKISTNESIHNGKYTVVGISSTSFKYNILETPEIVSDVEYYTDSISARGSIQNILVTNKGKNYKSLPGISSVISNFGLNAILIPETTSIGKISSIEIEDIGFDYSVDNSIRPTTKIPDILLLDSLSSFDYIGITSRGKNYNIDPTLIVIDGLTNEIINDVNLTCSIKDSTVTINKNTNKLSNAIPKIIPTNNSNGVGISSIQFNSITKDVTVTLGSSFSNSGDFPFYVGGKVLIEGINVGIASTAKGYNSSNYNYSLFTVKSIDPNIGGIGATISYSLSSYLNEGEYPGTFNRFYSSGKIIPEDHFPIFNPVLKNNDFYNGEIVSTPLASGNVESWDPINQYLKVSSVDDFNINDTIVGKTSGSTAKIKSIISFDSSYRINSSSKSRKGWNTETGFLNNELQRVHDSDYYQYFSYALESQKDFDTWNDAVSTLNHTSGFKKFSNLIVKSTSNNGRISTEQNQGDFTGFADLSRVINLNCINDFDLVKENNLNIDNNIKSDQIYFNSRIIQDYIESIGNRVLLIDDISDLFNSNPRSTEFSVVNSFLLEDFRSKKYIIFVQDKRISTEKQITLVSLLHNDTIGFLNQYGMETITDLGSFDFTIFGDRGNVLFYPTKSKVNDYHVQIFDFSLNDISSGIGTIDLGNVVHLQTNKSLIPQSSGISTTTIVGIASTYRSSKVLVQIGATNSSYFEYDELMILHDGVNVSLLDYGQVTTDTFVSGSSIGIGTYHVYLSGSDIKVDLITNSSVPVGVAYSVNTMVVSIANTNASGIGTQVIGGSNIQSYSTSIASTSSPTSNTISNYSNLIYNGSYSIVSVEDITNSQYQVSEILTITDSDNNCYITEFGNITTGSNIGIITAGTSGSDTNIYFTPIPDINVGVKVFQVNIGLEFSSTEFLLENGSLNYNYGSYTGTDNDIQKQFQLNHKTFPIFQRTFDGSNSSIVKINENVISIPNHFYVTGEEINYTYSKLSQPIGIGTTSIVGIGTTDKLPSTLYVVKLNDIEIQVSASASEALQNVPKVLNITSVGIGNSHTFTSKNPNKKSIISIDNVIQSPIVSTSVTTKLSKNTSFFDSEIFVSGISSIFGGDLIKIDNEIMKVTSVGVGSTNSISVIRTQLGSGISSHLSNSLVSKVLGNYNIVDNSIYFIEAPFGKVPFTNVSNRPDEVDYTGIVTGSSFSGRVFLRSGITNSNQEPYVENYIFDDISNNFNGNKNNFTLKSEGSNVTGMSTDNAIVLINNIFQGPNSQSLVNDYSLTETSGITSITFTGNPTSNNYDVNTSSVPRGGIILSVGSNQGFGYQPLVAAGGTAVVSTSGTIQSISIGNSGSGYRSGIQTNVRVGVQTEGLELPNITYVGIASIKNGNVVSVAITNPGIGYTSSNPPIVIFDNPLSYANVPLVYSSTSSGIGTGAVVDIIVGQGSSVISFELKNLGFGYQVNDVLTVSIGGTTGIPTNTSLTFSEFQLTIDRVQNDKFSAWSVGGLQVIDPLDELFDGERTTFPILIDGNQTTIRAKKGSNIDIQSSLLVFINDVLQVPGEGYIFEGGSTITFTEPPKGPNPNTGGDGDTCKILFYKGTGEVDTKLVDILENIKVGDKVMLMSDDINLKENDRVVNEIVSSDTLNTNLYPGPGISRNRDLSRPLVWCKQTEDVVINGNKIGKNRLIYEPYVYPNTNIIQNVETSSSVIYVESVKTFFDSEKEYIHNGTTEKPQNKIIIISQDSLVTAAATASISVGGTVTSINISDGGVGYTTSPLISISSPNTLDASAVAVVNFPLNTIEIDNFVISELTPNNISVNIRTLSDHSLSSGQYVTIENLGFDKSLEGLFQVTGIGSTNPKEFTYKVNVNIDSINLDADTEYDVIFGGTVSSEIYSEGTIQSIQIISPGYGYTSNPQITIQPPSQIGPGLGITATAVSHVSAGIVTFIEVTNPGFGYTFVPTVGIASAGHPIRATATSTIVNGTVQSVNITNPGSNYVNDPIVLFESPETKYEIIDDVDYDGDFGVITGIKTTSVGVASTGIILDLFIPVNSYLRDNKIVKVGVATTGISGIQTGYYFVVNKSNVGKGLTSLDSTGSIVGIGTSFIDNVYQVASVSIAQTSVPGVGLTYVAQVTISVSNYNGLSGIGISNFYGEYSWGRISTPTRINSQSFTSYAKVGGISTSPIIQRFNRLKYIGYSTS